MAPTRRLGSAELRAGGSFFAGAGDGWRVDRRLFDASLAREAEGRGVVLRNGATVRDAMYDVSSRRWSVCVDDGAESRRITARYVVDAGGPSARIARKLGASFVVDDALYAVVARYAGGPWGLPNLIVEAAAAGWWYAVEVPGDVLVVAFVTDLREMRRTKPADSARWLELLRSTRHIAPLVHERRAASLDGVFVPSRRTSPAAGPGWIAVGDAALASDPLASLGIGFALNSGANAARAVAADLAGQPAAAQTYARRVTETFEQYRTIRHALYGRERRWADAPFWAQRAAAAEPR